MNDHLTPIPIDSKDEKNSPHMFYFLRDSNKKKIFKDLLEWNIIDIKSSLIFLVLDHSSEPLGELVTRDILWMDGVDEIHMIRIGSGPADKYLIDLSSESLPLLILSYPDTDIELS